MKVCLTPTFIIEPKNSGQFLVLTLNPQTRSSAERLPP